MGRGGKGNVIGMANQHSSEPLCQFIFQLSGIDLSGERGEIIVYPVDVMNRQPEEHRLLIDARFAKLAMASDEKGLK